MTLDLWTDWNKLKSLKVVAGPVLLTIRVVQCDKREGDLKGTWRCPFQAAPVADAPGAPDRGKARGGTLADAAINAAWR